MEENSILMQKCLNSLRKKQNIRNLHTHHRIYIVIKYFPQNKTMSSQHTASNQGQCEPLFAWFISTRFPFYESICAQLVWSQFPTPTESNAWADWCSGLDRHNAHVLLEWCWFCLKNFTLVFSVFQGELTLLCFDYPLWEAVLHHSIDLAVADAELSLSLTAPSELPQGLSCKTVNSQVKPNGKNEHISHFCTLRN